MVIKRTFPDGSEQNIELTNEELRQAHWEYQRDSWKCDLMTTLNRKIRNEWTYEDTIQCDDDDLIFIGKKTLTGKELKALVADDEWMEDLVLSFEKALENNDSFWESYWMTADCVIETAIERTE